MVETHDKYRIRLSIRWKRLTEYNKAGVRVPVRCQDVVLVPDFPEYRVVIGVLGRAKCPRSPLLSRTQLIPPVVLASAKDTGALSHRAPEFSGVLERAMDSQDTTQKAHEVSGVLER